MPRSRYSILAFELLTSITVFGYGLGALAGGYMVLLQLIVRRKLGGPKS